jgi:hypothetical protein
MANWYGYARSNAFRVKDTEAFEAALAERHLGVKPIRNEQGQMTLLAVATDDGGWPSWSYNADIDDDGDFDIAEFAAPYLADGEVAVFLEVGAYELLQLTGFATASDSTGRSVTVSLSDIYEAAARELGIPAASITRAES